MWRGDVQEIEGINNMVQMWWKIAPRMSDPLMDARVGNRKDFGLGSKATRVNRWSSVEPLVEQILDDAVQYFG